MKMKSTRAFLIATFALLISSNLSTHFPESNLTHFLRVALKAQEEMFSARVQVSDATVSAETALNYMIEFGTVRVQDNDYLLITLPVEDSQEDVSGCNFVAGRAICEIQDGLSIKSCLFVSLRQVKITYHRVQGSVNTLKGSIRNFKNPDSSKPVRNILLQLFSSNDQVKAVYLSGEINFFQPTSLQAALSSSSSMVGATGTTLTITITPSKILSGIGFITVTLPEYYKNAGSDYMISITSPTCSAQSTITVLRCAFDNGSRTLKISYEFKNRAVSRATASFFVENAFKNPITPEPKLGFTVSTFDYQEYAIGSQSNVALTGVTIPNTFKYVTFSLDRGTNVIGKLNALQVNLGMNLPLTDQCWIKFQFPSQMALDENLYEATGSNFFTQAGTSSNKVPFQQVDKAKGQVVVQACQVINGANQVASITFNKIQNPLYVATTNSFEITMATDPLFKNIFVQQTSGIVITADKWVPGFLTGSVTASNYVVSASTPYIFQIQPPTKIDATSGSQIKITFTSLVSFANQNTCSLTNRLQLSSTATCSVSGKTATIDDAFKGLNHIGGNTVQFSLGTLVNPISARDIGEIEISTYVRVSQTLFLVDQAKLSNQIKTTPGEVTPLDQTSVSSYVTYDTETVYIFKMSFDHAIPVGSSVAARLPVGMNIFSRSIFNGNCYRLDKSKIPIKLTCTADTDLQGFMVLVESSRFGAGGIQAREEFRLQVSSITNPRAVERLNEFYFQSQDSLGFQIDVSRSNSLWNVKMTQIGNMQLIQASAANSTNGQVTSYTLVFTVNTPVEDGDRLELRFPKELQLPSSTNMPCSASDNINRLTCTKSTNNLVLVTLTNVATIVAGQQFTLKFGEIRNAISLRPTSSWSDIYLMDFGRKQVSGYNKQVFVTNTQVTNIIRYELIQSTKEPDVEAEYTIKFTTNNEIPYTGALLVRTPLQVSIVRDKYRCFVTTNSKRRDVCEFEGNSIIKIADAFANQPRSYTGTVEVTFVAQNPASNQETKLTLELIIYDQNDYKYKIDQITSGLNPLFFCNFPCATCEMNNPNHCLSCPPANYQPQYLQPNKNGTATCKNACEAGFTYNPRQTTKLCVPCDVSCKTCRVGGGPTDAEICLSCSDAFPLRWDQQNKCFPLDAGCPRGSYRQNKFECKTCSKPCLDCRGPNLCNYCDPFSLRPLLENRVCVDKCKAGFTPMYTGAERKGVCQACEAPCATCFDGLPQKCLTCAKGDKQFLFGSQCLEECPDGTATNLETKLCTGCTEGCKLCSPKDNSVCLVCNEGLSMLNNECLPECPEDYVKSEDGATCELRLYPLNKFYVPFPFVGLLVIFYSVILASWLLTRRDTLLCQNMIAASSIVLIFCVIFQIVAAINEGGQPMPIVLGIVILAANLVINVAFYITFKIQIDDYKFNEFAKYNFLPIMIVNILVLSISLHNFRLIYGKLFQLPMFHAVTTSPTKFFKPLLYYSLIQIGCVSTPILLSNVYYSVSTGSDNVLDNQLQLTYIELMIISFMLIALVLYERFYQHPRYINFRPEHDAISIFQSVFGNKISYQGLMESENEKGTSAKGKKVALIQQMQSQALQDRLDRHKQLRQLLSAVRSNKDTGLNVQLDGIMDEEMRVMADKQDSQPSPRLRPIITQDSQQEPEPVNYSWEGAVEKWNDDGTEKRLKLLAWMEHQMQQAAERERLEYENQQLKLRFQEKESMYDNQMFDNVFFSAKSKRDNEVQAEQVLKSIGQQMSNQSLIDFKLQEELEKEQNLKQKSAKKKAKQQARLDNQRVKQIQTSEIEFKVLEKDSSRSKASTKQPSPARKKAKLNIQSSDDNVSDTSSYALKQKSASKKTSLKNLRSEGAKASIQSAQQKLTSLAKPDEDGPQGSPRSQKSKQSYLMEVEESIMFTEDGHSQQQQRPKRAMQPIPHQNQHSHDPEDDLVLGDEQASRMVSEDKTLQSMQRIDERTPGPETSKWIKRVKLMKTLMLDCRDASHLPQNRFIDEDDRSYTSRTQGGARADTSLNEVQLVEDLLETSEELQMVSNESSVVEQIINEADIFKPPEEYEWQKININLTQRCFNIFSVLGNFPLDSFGRIINRKRILEDMDYKDFDGLPVNERGYLINESTGAIYSKFTFEDLFMPISQSVDDYGELPMPFRLERFNFNPHKIIGNFDYDSKTRKPIFYKNKFGQLTDKSYRPVNMSGFLINEQEDIVDNMGEVKFKKSMLTSKGDLPMLFNYKGEQYRINDIIGQFQKDSASKDIICSIDYATNRMVDNLGRPVNANGYLIDKTGNIINTKGEPVFMFWELIQLEPPKLFTFTEWTIDWIKGNYSPTRVLGFNPKEDYLYDDDQRMINTNGYLIDRGENVIDYYGRIVFKNDLLVVSKGQDACIPPVFTMGVLLPPLVEKPDNKRMMLSDRSSTLQDNTTLNKSAVASVSKNTIHDRSGNSTKLQGGSKSKKAGSKLKGAKGPTSIFNVQESDQSDNKSSINIHEDESEKKKRQKKIKRQNSAVIRYGKKVLNLYHNYLDNAQVPDKKFSSLNQAETTNGLPIRPILVTPSVSRIRANNDYTSNSMVKILPQAVNNVEENPTRFQRNDMRLNSEANMRLSRTPSVLVGGRPPRVRINQLMRGQDEPSPILIPKRTPAPDNSYAARAEGIFLSQTRQLLSREEGSETPQGLMNNNLRHNRNDSRLAISQQLDDINSIYGKLNKKQQNRTRSDM